MSERRVVQFRLSPAVLAQALGLPETANVIGAQWSFDHEGLVVYVQDETLPVVPEGCVPMLVRPVITQIKTAEGVVSRQFNWNLHTY